MHESVSRKTAVLCVQYVAFIISVGGKGKYLAAFKYYSIARGIAKLILLPIVAHRKACVEEGLSVAVIKPVVAFCVIYASTDAGILIEHNIGSVGALFNTGIVHLVGYGGAICANHSDLLSEITGKTAVYRLCVAVTRLRYFIKLTDLFKAHGNSP